MNNLDYKKIAVWAAGVVAVVIVLWFSWSLFFSTAPQQATDTSGTFGTAGNQVNSNGGGASSNNGTNVVNKIINTTAPSGPKKVFGVAAGPIAGATLLQTQNPTTTSARYVMQDNGHVFDLVLDSPGAVAKAVSNTTIPGIQHTVWLAKGNVILQYASGGVIKSVYLGFPASSTVGTQIQFLPDNIKDISASPDGKNIAYLLAAQNGTSGFIANPDGSNSKKLFSLPLSQLLLSWPATNKLLLTTKPAAGVPGMAFSVDTKQGGVVPILYAQGLTAVADASFSTVIYQTADGSTRASYNHTVKTNLDTPLSFDPFPEQCRWSNTASSTLYCATPLSYVAANYLDLWHQGVASVAESIVSFDLKTSRTNIIATPGIVDGGVASDISEFSLSPDDHYLVFITKGDRALWGVRLAP